MMVVDILEETFFGGQAPKIAGAGVLGVRLARALAGGSFWQRVVQEQLR